MKTLKMLVLFTFLFSFGLSQEKIESSWKFLGSRHGVVNYSMTAVEDSGRLLETRGVSGDPGLLSVSWAGDFESKKILQEIYGDFYLGATEADSVQLIFLIQGGDVACFLSDEIYVLVPGWQNIRLDVGELEFLSHFNRIQFVIQFWAGGSPLPTGGVVAVKNLGFQNVDGQFEVDLGSRTTGVSETKQIRQEFVLGQNYPNPFNPSTRIGFSLSKSGHTSLKVYDMMGREISTLIDQTMGEGDHEVSFDGSKLSSGTYFYRITTGNSVEMKKMILMK